MLGLALGLVACGSASAESGDRASSRGGSNRQGTAGGAASGARPASDATAEWQPCEIPGSGLSLWLPTPHGAHVERERDSCLAMPRPGLEPGDAEWFFGLAIVEGDDDEAALLGIEPDGARRFIVEAVDIESPVSLGEGTIDLLGTEARWYALRGPSEDVGTRDLVVARVRQGRDWVVALAVAHPGDRARLDEMVRLLGLARRR